MRRCLISAIFLVLCAVRVSAVDHFVSLTSPNPTAPYTNWDTAATSIQDAIDAANPGDRVIVTNGLYNTGGRVEITITNRVAITKPLTVQSVNGPAVTIIEGYQTPGVTNGNDAVRCVFMTNNTTLIGFTITHGATGPSEGYDTSGGGVWCSNFTNSILSNCIIFGNSASGEGGGVILGTLNDCLIATNSASQIGGGTWYSTLNRCVVNGNYAVMYGGGAVGNWGTDPNTHWTTANDCTFTGNITPGPGGGVNGQFLNNCLVIGNQASSGGGVYSCRLYNCTVVSNSAPDGAGVGASTILNSIVYYNNGPDTDDSYAANSCTPFPHYGDGNATVEPLFVNPTAVDFHLQSNSPCINAANNVWLTYTNIAQGNFLILMTNDIVGNPRIVGGIADMGAYEFQGNIRYVNVNSTNPVPPYSDWSMAATTIQDAIDAANPGDTVLVTNGLYNTGGRVVDGLLTNRVAITKTLLVQSVNGPDVTIIEGYQIPGITNGPSAVRGVYMTTNTALIGFTITRGATDTNFNSNYDAFAGGVLCLGLTNSVLSNCIIIANFASYQAGGVAGGTLNNCIIANNSSPNIAGGAEDSTLNYCLVTNNYSADGAGGLYGNSGFGSLNKSPVVSANYCIIAGNSSGDGHYGGASLYILNHCLVIGNHGPGAAGCRLFNCTVISNSVGIYACDVLNSIVYYNDTNYPVTTNPYFSYSCTTPLPKYGNDGTYNNEFQNIAAEPLFVDPAHGDFHLQPNSPCINSGNNAFLTITTNESDLNVPLTILTNDFDGNPRLVGGTVDLGLYEFQSPTSKISYAWLQQYGLPLDGSADNADPDGDGMSNWQEWRAGTLPFDNTSLLLMLSPTVTPTNATLTWQSISNVTYFLQRSAQPGTPFSTIQSNIVGWAGATSYTDTNAVGSGPFFYRVGVQ